VGIKNNMSRHHHHHAPDSDKGLLAAVGINILLTLAQMTKTQLFT
jgi:hypothetical protein